MKSLDLGGRSGGGCQEAARLPGLQMVLEKSAQWLAPFQLLISPGQQRSTAAPHPFMLETCNSTPDRLLGRVSQGLAHPGPATGSVLFV